MFKSKVMLALRILQLMRKAADDNERLTVLKIAADLNASESYVEQTMSVLSGSGLVKGVRGPGGGYSLIYVPDSHLYRYEATWIKQLSLCFYPEDKDLDLVSTVFECTPLAAVIL